MFIGVNADDAPYILANGYQTPSSKTYVSCSDTSEETVHKDCVLLANKHRSWKHAYEFPWRNPEAAWESIEAEQLQP